MVRDNLGSIIAVVNAAGGKVFEAEYDAWGNQTVTRNDIRLSRGYTGHEMLPQFGLIHMDGRVYDPVIGRFLSPDNYVQLPENSQSFNRYSYCLNNPLKYTDPTGENFLAALAINVGVSMFCAAAEGENVWRAAAFGALGACASYGIGCAFGHTAGNVGRELLRAGAHGISGGVQSALQGGSFFSGFASGATASMAGSGAQWAGWNNAGVLNATTAGGAFGAWISGGNVFDGASLGYSIGALNHTYDEDEYSRCYYIEPAPSSYIEPMPWQMPANDYSISYSNDVGFMGTGVDLAAKGWSALSIHTKSKLTWEAFKFSRDKLGYRFKSNNSTIYRKIVPQKLSYASKVMGRVVIALNVFENFGDAYRNNRIGLGNSVDFGVTCASLRGGVWGLLGGLLYLGSDYLTYKNTGMDIREHLNLKYSISW